MCVADAGRAQDFKEQLGELSVPYAVIRAGPDLNPLLVGSLRREIRAFRPDMIHTHLIHADLHGQLAARLAGVAGVSSIHGTHSFYRREPYRSAGRIAGRSARRTIAISEHVRRFIEHQRLSRPGGVRLVPYGIDPSGWSASDGQRAAARAALGLNPDDVAVGVASRLVAHKGHSFLLRGHADASRRAPQLRLLVAGDGPLRADLERQARGLDGRVRFLGFVPDIQGFMNACDVFVFPSQPQFGEGFGLAALEAMAAALPVVATTVASLPEIVRGEETGVLVDSDSAAELSVALVRLAENPELRRMMGERGRERASATFSLRAMAERTIAVYNEVADEQALGARS
jgi:glycosyltransferase involved in cell wall biosynthesis